MGQAGSSCKRESFDTKATLAVKLGYQKPIILSFISPYCGLCRSLERDLCEVGAIHELNRIESSRNAWRNYLVVFYCCTHSYSSVVVNFTFW